MLEDSLETPNEKDAKIKNLESKLNQVEEKIRKYELQIENLNTEKKQLEKNLQDDKEVADRIADDRNKLQKEYELLLNQFTNLTEEAEKNNIDVAKYKSQLNNMQEILTKQNNDLNYLANDNQHLRDRNQYLDRQNFIKRNEIDNLKSQIVANDIYNLEKCETQELEYNELKKQNDNLRKQIELLKGQNNSDSWIAQIICDDKFKKLRLIIGISLAVVGLLSIISPFVFPLIFGMDAIIFGAVFFVSAILSAPALFYENLSKEKLRNNGLEERKDVQDGAFFKKVSGLVFGIGLILAAAACLAFPILSVVLFSKAINDILCLFLALIGAYLTSRFYAIKIPEYPQNIDPYQSNNNMYVRDPQYQNEPNNSIGYGQNIMKGISTNFNQFGQSNSLQDNFKQDDNEFPDENEIYNNNMSSPYYNT